MLILLILSVSAAVFAQEPEVIVGEIGFPQRVWGIQTLPFEVTNNTDWLKFLIVETDAQFEGSYVNPHRVVHANFVLEPAARIKVEPKLEIPPNYGRLTFWVRIYDVVDTLDDMALGTLLFEQPFMLRFHTPEAVIPYFQERITLPPLVGQHGLFDNEFARLLLVLFGEGKTLPEAADLCQADTAYVSEVVGDLAAAGFLTAQGDSYSVAVPVISRAYAEAARPLADRISERLVSRITENLALRHHVIDSLVAAGVYTGDSTNFLEGGTVLYQPYPLVAGLYLWQVLGQKFISGQASLEIFRNTNECDPRIGPYMYVVQGGDYFNGHHYYSATATRGGYNSHFGDSIPEIECKPGFEKKRVLRENADWNFASESRPESFVYDASLVNPMLRRLDDGIEEILLDASGQLADINKQFLHGDLAMGTRYWFWNLTASRTLDQLVASGALIRTGNGQFKFMEKQK
jgi:hypothetical protein